MFHFYPSAAAAVVLCWLAWREGRYKDRFVVFMDVGVVVPDLFNPERVARMSWADISRARQSLDFRPLGAAESGTVLSGGAGSAGCSEGDAVVKDSETAAVHGDPTGESTGESGEGKASAAAAGGCGGVLDEDIDTLVAKLVHRSATAEMRERQLEARLKAMEKELQRERDKAARMWKEEAEERGEQLPRVQGRQAGASVGYSEPSDPSEGGHPLVCSEYDDSIDKVHPNLQLEEDPFGDGSPRVSVLSSLPESVGSAGQLNSRGRDRPSTLGGGLLIRASGAPVANVTHEGRMDKSIASSFVTDSQHPSSGKEHLLSSHGEYDLTSSSTSRDGESNSGGVRTVSAKPGPSSSPVEENVYHSYSDTSSDGPDAIQFDDDEYDAVSMCPSHFSDAPAPLLANNADEADSSVLSSDIHLEVGLPPIEYSDVEVPYEYRKSVRQGSNNKNDPAVLEPSRDPSPEKPQATPPHAPRLDKQPPPLRPRAQPKASTAAAAHKRCCAIILGLPFEQEPELPTGIDFGSYSLKVATVGDHGADIVTNALSERSTPTAVSFAHDIRAYGSQALSDVPRKPSTVFWGPEQAQFKSSVKPAVVNGTVIRAEVVVAQSLRNAKLWLSRHPRPVVFTVPASADQRQRRAILHAAELAGMRVDGLVTESVAAAVVRSQDFIASDRQASTEVIIDVGAGHMEMCKVKYTRQDTRGQLRSSRKTIADVKLIGPCVFDDEVGTVYMDRLLVLEALRRFEELHGEIPMGAARDKAKARLEIQAASVRSTLSASHEIMMRVESLYNGEDFSMKVTRDGFEEIIKGITKRIDDLTGRMTWEDVEGIELIGGGCRIPSVQQHIEAQVYSSSGQKIPLGRHLDGDDAPSKGAAVCASNHSLIERDPSLKGNKRIWLTDAHHRTYTIGWEEGSSERVVVIKAGEPLSTRREVRVSVPSGGRGIINLYEDGPDGTRRAIERYSVTSLHSAVALDIVVKSDAEGIVSLAGGTAAQVEVTHLDYGEMSPAPMKAAELEGAKLLIDAWDRRDQDANTLLEALNRLESKMYASRDTLDSEIYTLVATDDEMEHIRAVLADTEEVVDKGSKATAEDILSQTEALDNALSPVLDKGRELEYRTQTKNWTESQLQRLRALVGRIEAHRSVDNDEADKKEKARNLLDSVQNWWKEVSTKQEGQSLKEPPANTKEAAHSKIHRVTSLIEGIARTMGVNMEEESSKSANVAENAEWQQQQPSVTIASPEVERELGDGSAASVPNQGLKAPAFYSEMHDIPKVGHAVLESSGGPSLDDRLSPEL
ncbi:hypothetical protein FOL47_007272 [Perkinsus chesapeaki]|uniref:Hypoxia up-regulated protein 1 n=1 Tax=Perkinsus chesapeaki TaxID=330153 RepID=A0A7J6LLL8_PERCH|nr:hypothetical protein FOL47_007272 [Perkinsus chesapeaki]